MADMAKWKLAVVMFIICVYAPVALSGLAFHDLKDESNWKHGAMSVPEDYLIGLANMNLEAGDVVVYEFEAPSPAMFVIRQFVNNNPVPPGDWIVNMTGESGSGEIEIMISGFYVFSAESVEPVEGYGLPVTYDLRREVPLGLSRAYVEMGLSVGVFVVAVAILVEGNRWARGPDEDGKAFLAFWSNFVTHWQSWLAGIAGVAVVVAAMLIRFSSPGLWDNDYLGYAHELGGLAAFWGLVFGLTYTRKD